MFGKVVVCQEQITAGTLTANEGGRPSHRNYLRGRRGSW